MCPLQMGMRLRKVLLYPFSAESPYFESYAWAVELASRMNARLQLFTSVSPAASPNRDSVYHSLLEAQGYYLTHYQSVPAAEIKSEPLIAEGDLPEQLVSHLKNNPVDVVVLDSIFLSKHYKKLGDIVDASGGVIALSAAKKTEQVFAKEKSDHFYDILRKAELYNLPENFFNTLGRDHAVFNYLRKLFQSKKS